MAAKRPQQKNPRVIQSYADVMDTSVDRSDQLNEMLQAAEEKWTDRFNAMNSTVEALNKQTTELMQVIQLQVAQATQQQTMLQAIKDQTAQNQQILEETRALKASLVNLTSTHLRNQQSITIPTPGPIATSVNNHNAAQQLQTLNNSLDEA
jgi:uncharacterized protein (DUF885 family)